MTHGSFDVIDPSLNPPFAELAHLSLYQIGKAFIFNKNKENI